VWDRQRRRRRRRRGEWREARGDVGPTSLLLLLYVKTEDMEGMSAFFLSDLSNSIQSDFLILFYLKNQNDVVLVKA